MIYTVTFNPSLDYIVSVDDFKLGLTNRTSSELILPGGKGTNVSTVLKNLGLESTALGFVAGFTGNEIVKRLNDMGIKSDFISIENGISRINLKLKSIDGTEINGAGPDISEEKVNELMDKLNQLKEGDVLVLAGSIPGKVDYHNSYLTIEHPDFKYAIASNGLFKGITYYGSYDDLKAKKNRVKDATKAK